MNSKAATPGHDAKSLSSRLLRLLTEQLLVAQELDAASRRQSEAILSRQQDDAVELLDERARLITTMHAAAEQITAIARALTGKVPPSPATGAWRAELISAVVPELREPVSKCITQLDAALVQIQQRDSADVRTLAAQRDDVARELAMVSMTNRAAAAYGVPPGTPGAVYQDRQG